MKPVTMKNTKVQLLEAVQQRDAYILKQAKELEHLRLQRSVAATRPARVAPVQVRRYMKQGELWEKVRIGFNEFVHRKVAA